VARHWRGVAFPNGETDLVKSTKLALSDDLRSLKPGKRSRVWRGFQVALHILHIHIANGHHSPSSIGRWKFRIFVPFIGFIASMRDCDPVPLHVVTVVVRGTVLALAWTYKLSPYVPFLMGLRDVRFYADRFVTSCDHTPADRSHSG